jgi:hypothetical protein
MAATTTRRPLALVLALAMVMALLPMLQSAAWAEEISDTIETEASLSASSSSGAVTAADTVDACPPGIVPPAGFTDVSGQVGAAANCLAWYGITQGRTATTFDALSNVRRDQLASFLVNTMRQAPDFTLPPRRFGAFPDVTGGVHAPNIETLAGFNPAIVQGFADGRYGPLATVTRGQAASFFDRTYTAMRAQFPDELPALPAGNPGAFSDVPAGFVHAGAIARLNAAGVIQGFGDGTFGPNRTLTRGQMSLLLTRFLQPLVSAGVVERPDGGPVDPTPEVGTLTGSVLNDDDGAAISGATVSITGPASRSATTNANGAFTIANLPVGSYQVTATAADFEPTTTTATITRDASTTVTLRLAPVEVAPTVGSIAGSVVDDDTSAPISGAAVTVTQGATEITAVTTAADGTFAAPDLTPGTYTVTATADDYDTASTDVTVVAGETVTANLRLEAEGTDPTDPDAG